MFLSSRILTIATASLLTASFSTSFIYNSPFTLSSAEPVTSPPSELQAIETELQTLEKELSYYRKKSMNDELQAQPYMLDNWHQYAEGIRMNEHDERRLLAIKARIVKLTERKKELLQR